MCFGLGRLINKDHQLVAMEIFADNCVECEAMCFKPSFIIHMFQREVWKLLAGEP